MCPARLEARMDSSVRRSVGIDSTHCWIGGFLHPVFCILIPISASTPFILGRSRCRCARTDLCGRRPAMVVPTATKAQVDHTVPSDLAIGRKRRSGHFTPQSARVYSRPEGSAPADFTWLYHGPCSPWNDQSSIRAMATFRPVGRTPIIPAPGSEAGSSRSRSAREPLLIP
jgi:hypothetical protein